MNPTGGLYDVIYPSPGLAEIRTGMTTGHQSTDGNAWCNEGGGTAPTAGHRSASDGLVTAACCHSHPWAARQAPAVLPPSSHTTPAVTLSRGPKRAPDRRHRDQHGFGYPFVPSRPERGTPQSPSSRTK